MNAMGLEEINESLDKLSDNWSLKDNSSISCDFKFEDFESALRFVNIAGQIAEKQNHHPEVLLTYGNVKITLSTHSANGLTTKDFESAKILEETYRGA